MNQYKSIIFNTARQEYALHLADHSEVARVVTEQKGFYKVMTDTEEGLLCQVTGKMRFRSASREDLPAVGDWVTIRKDEAIIERVLPRKSKFSRKMAGNEAEEQIIAANIDTVFILSSLNDDLNLHRIERYVILCWESGANPVVILTKADVCTDVAERVSEVEAALVGVPVLAISSLDRTGLEALYPYLTPGKTVALTGSSGVGKSTLTNELLQESLQKTKEVRDSDDKGKHTTTHRELFLLDSGAALIDTPGMREIQILQGSEGLSTQFNDVEELARSCRFNDCSHGSEPGCAIRIAIEEGSLSEDRYLHYEKLQREIAYMERRGNKRLESLERKKWKSMSKKRKN
ncbi:ribosome small subunit-dependent GTPase A [Rossellomorea marisflavi]|uniref:ribosome small subunit-dependent GTPase A n=1 Tax=Rossellomorea marisflavi TaxID=189381 RepID=UPI0034584AA8